MAIQEREIACAMDCLPKSSELSSPRAKKIINGICFIEKNGKKRSGIKNFVKLKCFGNLIHAMNPVPINSLLF